MEEILGIKDDIQFLMENKSKSKIRDKLNQSLASCNNSLNSSFCSEHKNIDENNKDNFNNSFIGPGEIIEKMIIIIEDDTQKKIIFNVLIIESLIKKDKNLKSFVDKLRNKFPLIDEIKKDKK